MDFRVNKYYFTLSDEEVPEEVKFKTKQKYPFKVLVWVAISEKGNEWFHDLKSHGEPSIQTNTLIFWSRN